MFIINNLREIFFLHRKLRNEAQNFNNINVEQNFVQKTIVIIIIFQIKFDYLCVF